MQVRWVTLLLCLVMLVMAGCYQQAGDTYQPAQNAVSTQVELPTIEQQPTTDAPLSVTSDVISTPLDLNSQNANDGSPTLPPITVISPPTRTPDTGSSDTSGTETSPTEASPGEAGVTPQFITPGISLGPITPDATATPLPDALGTGDSTPSGLITPTALTTNNDGCTYTVQPGDNLFRIAVNNNTTVAEMKSANDLAGENPVLQVGQQLVIPGCNSDAQVSAPEPTTASATSVPAPAGGGEQYTIQPGDTLFRIAQRYGITVQAIVDANSLSNPNNLQVGQVITIPPSGG